LVVIDQGKGPVVLLIHGLGANHEDWRHVVPLLAEDHRVLVIDLPGFGETPALVAPTGVADYADAVWRAMDDLGVNQVDAVVGHSMGGAVAIELALTRSQRVARLGVVNSMPAFTPQTPRDHFEVIYRRFMVRTLGTRRLAKLSAMRMFPDPADAALRAPVIARGRTNRVGPYLDALGALIGWDARDRLSSWRKPLLWIASEYDYFDFEPIRDLRLVMPHMRVRCFPGERHGLPMARPDGVAREIRALMQL
jgi:3-oxoadipate enol-lactonase